MKNASNNKGNAPIIIIKRKKKKGSHDAHGGSAWKIAYADFVTAMMSFFLVMWLINTITSEEKEGISAYFSTAGTSGEAAGAQGVLGGEIVQSRGVLEAPSGAAPKSPNENIPDVYQKIDLSDKQLEEAQEQAKFEKAAAAIQDELEQKTEIQELKENIRIQTTALGLEIQLVDMSQKSMFRSGSSILGPEMAKLLTVISQSIKNLPNSIRITGHTDGAQYTKKSTYTNWELSADRANATRRFLGDLIGFEKIKEIAGKADTELLVPTDPRSPVNRRISIVLLRAVTKGAPAPLEEQKKEINAPQSEDRSLL